MGGGGRCRVDAVEGMGCGPAQATGQDWNWSAIRLLLLRYGSSELGPGTLQRK